MIIQLNRKNKIIIASAILAAAAIGGIYVGFKEKPQEQSENRFRLPPLDANLPNPDKQSPQQIISFIDNPSFKQLPIEQKMNYYFRSGEKIMEYHISQYASATPQEKTAILDSIIDRIQAERADMEKFFAQRQQQIASGGQTPGTSRQGGGQRRPPEPSRMRARSERGTPEQRAERINFMQALAKRAEQRGIQMPGAGGRPR